MNLDMINPYVLKIIISARRKDSIASISKRINLSYGWTYTWVFALIKEGVFKKQWRGFTINEKNKVYQRLLNFLRKNFNKNVSFYYSTLPLFGINYCFNRNDAVFVWTNGGYTISRYREYYPIFIQVAKRDKELFLWYCKKLNLKMNKKSDVFYDVEFVDVINSEIKDKIPVISLKNTVQFMKKNVYNFQPALEMVEEMYGYKTGVTYKEV